MRVRSALSADQPARLDPVRWRLPRRTVALRTLVVSGLLVVAAGALYTGVVPAADGCVAPLSGGSGPAVPTASAASGRLPVPAGRVGVPVRLAEPATAAILRTGDRVDLLAVTPSGSPTAVGTDAVVLAAGAASTSNDGLTGRDEAPDAGNAPGAGAGMVVLALTPAEATRTVGIARDAQLAVIVRR
jgi:hypothetical protein